MTGSLLKGALISFTAAGGALGLPSLPNVIVFQFNPESITHAWTEPGAPQPAQGAQDSKVKFSPLAVSGPPGESFSFTLMLDSDEQQADVATNPVAAGLAFIGGIYPTLAALELLQFPTQETSPPLVGAVSAAASAAGAGASAADSQTVSVPFSQVPIVLFVWGPLRIVPVRVTALSVSEKLYDGLLNPTHAEAQITLTVLTPDEIQSVTGSMAGIATAAYSYTQGVRQAQALANLGEAAASILGMLPTPF
jgi:hypothetical protein